MKLLMRGGERDGQIIDIGRVVRCDDPDWVDPEATDFDQKKQAGVTYQLKPKANQA